MNSIQFNKLKKTFIPFTFLFCFSSAIGVFYSIHNTADSNPQTVWVFLFFGLISFLLLSSLILLEISRLIFNIRKNRAGSKLRSKIVAVFGTIAIVPVLIVAILAVIFFERGIEAWFSKRVQTALEKSAAIAENYAVEIKNKIEGDALFVSIKLSNYSSSNFNNRLQLSYILNNLAIERDANELAIINSKGNIIAASRNSFFLPNNIIPGNIFANRKDKSSPLVLMNDNKNNNLSVITPILGQFGLYLYFSRYLDPVMIYNLKSVKKAVSDYSEAKKNSEESKITFTMVFVSIALILLLLAIWLGITFANSLIDPISSLISASESISSGNLKVRINNNEKKSDEINSLINSFNRMVKQLFDQRKDLVTANQQIDARRRFTESVLTGVKSGVLGVDAHDNIFLVNKSSLELLESDAGKLIGFSIYNVFPSLSKIIKNGKEPKLSFKEETLDYIVNGKKKKFVVRISFENYKSLNSGYVVTIENITELIKVQRAAAWADIAKRIAHEIKNPLTPIQLSADRLKHKYLNNISKDKGVFISCIDTIIRQVSSIHRMVNEFSTFAKMPRPIFQKININKIVAGSIGMNKLANHKIIITSNLDEIDDINLKADPNLINQVLNNLFKNSINAVNEENKKTKKPIIHIELIKKNNFCCLNFIDNGPGFPEDKEYLLEPYISRSKKGSGLGLAIIKKIMEDHKGNIELNNNFKNGANVKLSFPINFKENL
ncbi:MAG: ATP-binding protein [Pseudomonadota bacterium]|nr:ATP-binding protein [Pseudomonadota bacterium]